MGTEIYKSAPHRAIEAQVNTAHRLRPTVNMWRFQVSSALLVASVTLLVFSVGLLFDEKCTSDSQVGLSLAVVSLSTAHILLTVVYLRRLLKDHIDWYNNEVTAAGLKPLEEYTQWVSHPKPRVASLLTTALIEKALFPLFACEVVALTLYGVCAIGLT